MSDRPGPPPTDPDEDEALRRALGKAIGIRRLELGLKRNDLRDRSGLSYPYIAELENGTKRGSTRALVALASALELSVSELMERAEALRDQEEETLSAPERARTRSVSNFEMPHDDELDKLDFGAEPDDPTAGSPDSQGSRWFRRSSQAAVPLAYSTSAVEPRRAERASRRDPSAREVEPAAERDERQSVRSVRFPSRSRSTRVDVDLDELLQMIRHVVRDEVRRALRDQRYDKD